MVAPRNITFELGRTLATPGARDALAAASIDPGLLLARHHAGDWGDLSADDKAANDTAVRAGERILSAYRLPGVMKVWIVTGAIDDAGRRAATTIFLPDEY